MLHPSETEPSDLTQVKVAPGAWVLDGRNEYLGDRADRYGPNGYLRLELRGTSLHEAVVAPNGVVVWEQDLE
jgi:hypothetical protein